MVEEATGRGNHKVILLGEHAVVYGHPALGAPLGEGVWVRVRRSPALVVRGVEDVERVTRALQAILAAASAGPGLEVEIRSHLPAGAGLGGSAALCVGFARALATLEGHGASQELIAALAREGERVFHGNPSGMDAYLASASAPVLYRRDGPATPLEVDHDLHLAILVDEARGDTSAMVAAVAARREADPAGVGLVMAEIEALVLRGADAIREGHAGLLGRIMTASHDLLGRLGVTTPALDGLRDLALSAGALGAKMTGAGGGGALVALARDADAAESIARAATDRARLTLTATIAATGGEG